MSKPFICKFKGDWWIRWRNGWLTPAVSWRDAVDTALLCGLSGLDKKYPIIS